MKRHEAVILNSAVDLTPAKNTKIAEKKKSLRIFSPLHCNSPTCSQAAKNVDHGLHGLHGYPIRVVRVIRG